jgi:hypothetical protein
MPILRIKYALAALAFAACAAASAQGTFNIASSPGFLQNHFRHVIVHDDTIVGLGMAFSDSIEWRQGLIVAKYDSSGALLASAFLSDTLRGRLAVDRQWGKIAKASDGGYVLTAATVERKDAILFKLDASLREEFRHENADIVNLSNFRYQAPIEIEDGYILYGAIQRPNFRNAPFARRVDRQGNTVWHRYYGSSIDGIPRSGSAGTVHRAAVHRGAFIGWGGSLLPYFSFPSRSVSFVRDASASAFHFEDGRKTASESQSRASENKSRA